ncbi:unnamed protein product, partial [Brassica napus]
DRETTTRDNKSLHQTRSDVLWKEEIYNYQNARATWELEYLTNLFLGLVVDSAGE